MNDEHGQHCCEALEEIRQRLGGAKRHVIQARERMDPGDPGNEITLYMITFINELESFISEQGMAPQRTH